MESAKAAILGFWFSLSHDVRVYLWLAVGCLLLLVWAYVAYRVTRRALGHRYHGGRWLSSSQFHQYMEMLFEDQRAGKLLQTEDMRALRAYRHGNVREIHDQSAGGYHS